MEITNAIIQKADVTFKRMNGNMQGNWTIITIQTNKDKSPWKFKINRSFDTQEWQMMMIFEFVGDNIEDAEELKGKTVKVILDKSEQVVGYGSTKSDKFFLFQNPEIKSYTEEDLIRMEKNRDRLLTRKEPKKSNCNQRIPL